MKGPVPGSFGGYGGFPPPNPRPYGYNPGSAGYGFPGTSPASYPGIAPASLGSYQQPYPHFNGGYALGHLVNTGFLDDRSRNGDWHHWQGGYPLPLFIYYCS